MESRTAAENTAGNSGISCMGIDCPPGAPTFSNRDSSFTHILLNEAPLLRHAACGRLINNQLVHGLSYLEIAAHLELSAQPSTAEWRRSPAISATIPKRNSSPD